MGPGDNKLPGSMKFDEDDGIDVYKGQKADSRKPYVRINSDGRWYVNSSLSRMIGEETKVVCIGASRDRMRLYVWPSNGQGCEFSCKREKGGLSWTARSALCFWGLREKAVGKHEAIWNAERKRIEITLTPAVAEQTEEKAETNESSKPLHDLLKTAVDFGAAVEAAAAGGLAAKDDGEIPTEAGVTPSCGTCAHGTAVTGCERLLCDSQVGPNRSKLVEPDGLCNDYKPKKPIPPDRGIQAGVVTKPEKPHRQGSRVRAICPECGHNLSVTGKGIIPHDEDGVQYTGGRGDHERRCPGSNAQP